MNDDVCPECKGHGYIPTRPRLPGEVTGWPPSCNEGDAWRRCSHCDAADEIDSAIAASGATR